MILIFFYPTSPSFFYSWNLLILILLFIRSLEFLRVLSGSRFKFCNILVIIIWLFNITFTFIFNLLFFWNFSNCFYFYFNYLLPRYVSLLKFIFILKLSFHFLFIFNKLIIFTLHLIIIVIIHRNILIIESILLFAHGLMFVFNFLSLFIHFINFFQKCTKLLKFT